MKNKILMFGILSLFLIGLVSASPTDCEDNQIGLRICGGKDTQLCVEANNVTNYSHWIVEEVCSSYCGCEDSCEYPIVNTINQNFTDGLSFKCDNYGERENVYRCETYPAGLGDGNFWSLSARCSFRGCDPEKEFPSKCYENWMQGNDMNITEDDVCFTEGETKCVNEITSECKDRLWEVIGECLDEPDQDNGGGYKKKEEQPKQLIVVPNNSVYDVIDFDAYNRIVKEEPTEVVEEAIPEKPKIDWVLIGIIIAAVIVLIIIIVLVVRNRE